jgi:hypothetical protein
VLGFDPLVMPLEMIAHVPGPVPPELYGADSIWIESALKPLL